MLSKLPSKAVLAMMSAAGYGFHQAAKHCTTPLQFYLLGGASYSVLFYIGLFLLRNVIFIPGQLLPSILVGKLVDREKLKQTFRLKSAQRAGANPPGIVAKEIKIPSSDGVVLDGVHLLNPAAGADATAKYIIWMNANGVLYEQNVEFAEAYCASLGAHAIIFNYRGVGDSTGWPYVSAMLGEDGVAVVEHAIQKLGVKEENIVIHGHSIGGGVLAFLTRHFKKCVFVNDRSFWDLGAEASILLRLTGLSNIMGAFLGGYATVMFTVLSWIAPAGLPVDLSSIPTLGQACFFGGVFGYIVFGRTNIVADLTPALLGHMEWGMNSAETWDSERGLIIFHRQDGMIPYAQGAALHAHLAKELKQHPRSIELITSRDPAFNHMGPLNQDPAWPNIVQGVRNLFSATKTQ